MEWCILLLVFVSNLRTNDPIEGILLLDPPILNNQFVFQLGTKNNPKESIERIANRPYQRGYRDFTPWPNISTFPITDKQIAPHRISILDDICYYWTSVASQTQVADAMSNPYESSVFQRHIVASIWINTLEHLHAILSDLETMLWKIEEMMAPHMSDEKKDKYMGEFTGALNEVNTLRRRVSWYVTEMENNLYNLGIDPSSSSSDGKCHEDAKNFLAIYKRLLTYQSWAEKLMGVITSNANLMETEKSISDSKSLSRLTALGFFFVPVSFVATFFSMGGEFGAGQNRFWVYFAVAAPLTFATFAAAFGTWWWRKFWDWRDRVL